MDPIDDLTQNLVGLLKSLADRKDTVGDNGRKKLLDALRKWTISAEKISGQLPVPEKKNSKASKANTTLYLVK